jgi:5-formyltetrahydrofolate cyclo-ligase
VISRQELRNKKRHQRQSLSPQQQAAAARAIERQLIGSSVFCHARHIACYLANDGELDLSVVMTRMLAMKKRCYLPVLDKLGSKRLWFAPFNTGTRLQVNRFGIPEPMVSPREYVLASALDMILLPLVAFDNQGNRLGMGGGFYDRSLAYLQRRQCWIKPHLYGVAHELQRVDSLEYAAWDIPLHGIVTEERVYQIGSR